MNKQKKNMMIGLAVALALVLLVLYLNPGSTAAMLDELQIKTQEGRTITFNVEVASSPIKQMRGLMHRDSLDEDSGMLFVFRDLKKRSFWMKNTRIPLDMIFIGAGGTIVHIHSMAQPLDETHVHSIHPAKAVLEINGGQSEKLHIRQGDKVEHSAL